MHEEYHTDLPLMDPAACAQDYIGQLGRLNLHGLDAEIDVMVESKAKELSLLLYRQALRFGPLRCSKNAYSLWGSGPWTSSRAVHSIRAGW